VAKSSWRAGKILRTTHRRRRARSARQLLGSSSSWIASAAPRGITFCDSEEAMRRASSALDQTSPGPSGGRRTSVEIYEVGIDETFR
jgi:hypothetical protein